MLEAYGVDTIRAHEAAAIEQVGDDALMQRAAAGLAAAVARQRYACAAGSTAPGCWSWSARATTAATPCSPGPGWPGAGRAVTAVRCLGEPHARGLAALRAAGGRVIDIGDLDLVPTSGCRPAPRPETDLAVDGVLGIGGRPGLPDDVALLAPATWTGFDVPTSPSTCPRGSARTPARCRARRSGPPGRSPSASASPAT